MDSHEKGDFTEAVVLSELKRRNIPVQLPFGDNQRYDLVATDGHGTMYRFQVKTGRLDDGIIRFHTKSQHTNANGNMYRYYDGEIDGFLVYTHELDALHLVYMDQFDKQITLRVDEPDQPDASINWADDYRFDDQWPARPPEVRSISSGRSPAVKPVGNLLQERSIPFIQASGELHHFRACDDTGTHYLIRACSGSDVDGLIRFPTLEPGAVDAYCVHHGDEIYLVPDAAFEESFSLRIDAAAKRDSSINWATDYRFDSQWPPDTTT